MIDANIMPTQVQAIDHAACAAGVCPPDVEQARSTFGWARPAPSPHGASSSERFGRHAICTSELTATSANRNDSHYFQKGQPKMLRVSHEELVERWAQTYVDDGLDVRARGVAGRTAPEPTNGAQPDIEATADDRCIFAQIIDSPEGLTDPEVRRTAQRLSEARDDAHVLHLIVAAECMLDLGTKLAEWGVEPDLVHVT